MIPVSGIYMIKNTVTQRVYVGSSTNVERRRQEHVNQLNNGQHHDRVLLHDWHNSGPNAFAFTLLEPIGDGRAILPTVAAGYWDRAF